MRGEPLGIPSPHLGCHDVPVLVQYKFQQSVPIDSGYPPLQFIDRVLDTPVLPQRQLRTVQTVQQPRDSTVQFLVWFLTPCCATSGAMVCGCARR